MAQEITDDAEREFNEAAFNLVNDKVDKDSKETADTKQDSTDSKDIDFDDTDLEFLKNYWLPVLRAN